MDYLFLSGYVVGDNTHARSSNKKYTLFLRNHTTHAQTSRRAGDSRRETCTNHTNTRTSLSAQDIIDCYQIHTIILLNQYQTTKVKTWLSYFLGQHAMFTLVLAIIRPGCIVFYRYGVHHAFLPRISALVNHALFNPFFILS
jgi:hypothetical protein